MHYLSYFSIRLASFNSVVFSVSMLNYTNKTIPRIDHIAFEFFLVNRKCNITEVSIDLLPQKFQFFHFFKNLNERFIAEKEALDNTSYCD